MKKFLSILFTVVLASALSFAAGCSGCKKPTGTGGIVTAIEANICDSEGNYVCMNSESDGAYFDWQTRIYHLQAGEQYYLDIFQICDEGQKLYSGLLYLLIYNPEEIEILEKETTNDPCPIKGLKKGSVIIQFDDSNGADITEPQNYIKILIIFE